ncbi:MAG TPA: SRPBCC domain-containing protein [Actinophytocola sp.]|jgi:uncharacterized protein YndB with AHSA1/START domain|uniref:SRPBCC domain-containing protein n=1 Tax=Actinophytocola sp. TaxID=1872138 RepID=UPI002DF8D647|nr:SRPBCC domain-containing protein [Actinophytocola sp.]
MTELRTFTYVTYIASTREEIWRALTEPEFTRQYWNGRLVESDWRIGSPVTIRHDYDDGVDSLGGKVIIADHPRRLSYGVPPNIVTFELTEHDDVVKLTVIHEGLDDVGVASVSEGWAFIVSNLKTLLESGRPLPMPEGVLAAYR